MTQTKSRLLFFMAWLLTTTVRAQTFNQEQQEAQLTVVKLFDALSKRDSVGIKAFGTADITFYEYGQIWNMDTLILKAISLNQSADYKRTNTFEFMNTIVNKTLAWVTYRLHSVIFKEGKQLNIHWLESVVLVKEKKQWKVKHLHSTLISRN